MLTVQWGRESAVNLDPDFQRPLVWTMGIEPPVVGMVPFHNKFWDKVDKGRVPRDEAIKILRTL